MDDLEAIIALAPAVAAVRLIELGSGRVDVGTSVWKYDWRE